MGKLTPAQKAARTRAKNKSGGAKSKKTKKKGELSPAAKAWVTRRKRGKTPKKKTTKPKTGRKPSKPRKTSRKRQTKAQKIQAKAFKKARETVLAGTDKIKPWKPFTKMTKAQRKLFGDTLRAEKARLSK